jgi:sugar/nucleoside kinase (ribokinase family)
VLGQKFVAIGHITNDISPKEHLGGGVSYSAVAAAKLGLEAHIITKCSRNHRYIKELEKLGVKVHVIPSGLNTITTFDNKYNLQGKRNQIVTNIQESISPEDKKNIPWQVLKDSIIIVAPVTSLDVDIRIFPDFAKYGSLNIIPQGYFRKILKNGTVIHKKWEGFGKYISNANIAVLSDEDIPFQREIVKEFPLIALTQGAEGVMVYNKGEKFFQTKAFPLKKEELIDFEGAGDVFAATFIIEMIRNPGDIKAASVTASLFAAVKIAGIGGIGIDSIPSREQVKEFLKKHSKLDWHVVKL